MIKSSSRRWHRHKQHHHEVAAASVARTATIAVVVVVTVVVDFIIRSLSSFLLLSHHASPSSPLRTTHHPPPQQQQQVCFFLFVRAMTVQQQQPLRPKQTNLRMLHLMDLPTPSLVVDLWALRRKQQQRGVDVDTSSSPSTTSSLEKGNKNNHLLFWKPPSLQFMTSSGRRRRFHPILQVQHSNWMEHNDKDGLNVVVPASSSSVWASGEGIACCCYLHSRVTRARDDNNPETFLAQLDLLPHHMTPINALTTTTTSADYSEPNQRNLELPTPPPTLVLGLNNHHVISYYWARSAGAGAAMEAPGIVYDKGQLHWTTSGISGSSNKDNTNDGKRSEWVNFLRVGDTVQLIPHPTGLPTVLHAMGLAGRIYGISAQGRPLGSEPRVICQWQQVVQEGDYDDNE